MFDNPWFRARRKQDRALGLTFRTWPKRIYAIGDIHGRHDLLLSAQNHILADIGGEDGEFVVVQLGDAIDRGPQSADTITELQSQFPGAQRINLLGNHEWMLLDFLKRPELTSPWLQVGGVETLSSYGLHLRDLLGAPAGKRSNLVADALGQQTIDYLSSLPTYAAWPGICLVHAGIRPGLPLAAQRLNDLIWIREPFLSTERRDDLLVVHGHTPTNLPSLAPGRIGIDTGAYQTGVLTTVCLEQGRMPRFLAATSPLLETQM